MEKRILQKAHSLLLFFALFPLSILLSAQKIDPFYLKLLKDGENSYLTHNYKDAAKELEVAVFGLYQHKSLAGKAYIYLGLCYSHLNDQKRSEQCLKNALGLLGKDEFPSLEIHASARTELERLVKSFKLESSLWPTVPENASKKEIPKTQALKTPVGQTQQKKAEVKIDKKSIQELEKIIQDDPRRVELYYAIAQFYEQNDNFKAAKNTLQLLVENNPAEVRGHLELGKIAYQERNYKEAEKKFETFLQFAQSLPTEEKILAEAKLYLILSSYLRGDLKKLRRLLQESQEIFFSGIISDLPFSLPDKERLQTIWKTYGKK